MNSPPHDEIPETAMGGTAHPASGLSRRWLVGILVLAFLFVLMPFLFWRATWFGRPLTDEEISRSLADRAHPRKVQHALSQIADRIVSADPSVRGSARRWYPQVIALSSDPHAELRLTAAWVMGQDNTSDVLHEALRPLLGDPNPMVRRNAALSLVRFKDTQGRDEIAALLRPYESKAPDGGVLRQRLKPGESVNPGTLLARIEKGGGKIEVRSEVPGALDRWLVADGATVVQGTRIASIAPSNEELWEGLRALYLIGEPEDLPLVESFARGRDGLPDYVQQQAQLTARAIRARQSK